MDKTALRRDIRTRIISFDAAYIEKSDGGIFERLKSLNEYEAAETVFLYYSLDREPDTHRLAYDAVAAGKTVAMPRVLGEGRLEHLRVMSHDDLTSGVFGLREPLSWAERVEPQSGDIIIVPALCFDRRGFRLGRGGGYYDRFLASCPAFTVGITRQRLLLDSVPTEAHDIPVDCIVTENEIIRLK